MKKQKLHIGLIVLRWSKWYPWNELKKDARREGIKIPNRKAGVYEAKLIKSKERLTIGKTKDLRGRIRQALIRGRAGHPAGDDIRKNENTQNVVVRWALTERPAAAEEELHRQHKRKFGNLPKYTDFT